MKERAKAFKALMKKHGFTSKSLSEATGVSVGGIDNLRYGSVSRPRSFTLSRLARYLGQDVWAIYEGHNKQETPTRAEEIAERIAEPAVPALIPVELKYACPACHSTVTAPRDFIGKNTACFACGGKGRMHSKKYTIKVTIDQK